MDNGDESMKSFKEKLSDTAGIPKDVSLGVSILRITGQNEAMIENYRGILEYSNEFIRIQTKAGQIHIEGTTLQIEHYSTNEMKVTGTIKLLRFYQGG